jgi:type IV secretory pathway VirB10-like protein
MSVNDHSRNGSRGLPSQLDESLELGVAHESPAIGPTGSEVAEPQVAKSQMREEPAVVPASGFATQASAGATEGIGKNKLVLLGGALAIAVLFFVFTAIIGNSPRKPTVAKLPAQQTKQDATKPAKGSLTPVMETVRTPAPDNANGQLGPGDIRRTRSSDGRPLPRANAQFSENQGSAKSAKGGSLGSGPSFAETQQKWEEPQPYGESQAGAAPPGQQQNSLKEPSLIFVRAQTQGQAVATTRTDSGANGAPLLEMRPGTRIQAKLQTQISSAVQAPVVAVVEYTYAIGDRVVVPAGARVYGELQQADRSGLIGVKFDEIELLDGEREKIEAIGTGLDLGPIKGSVSGKSTGKNFLVRAVSGIGSVLAEVAGNNSSGAFSEDDILRERLAQNIGTAGDTEIMSLNASSRLVVSVPADTKIYIVFTKHEQSPSELHKVATRSCVGREGAEAQP